MSDLTPKKLDELRRLAATAADATTERTPWYSADDLLTYGVESEDDAPYFAALTPPIVLALLDAATELAHMREARDNARAEVERLTATVEAVRALHAPYYPLRVGCAYCEGCEGDEFAPYPCTTISALGGEAAVHPADDGHVGGCEPDLEPEPACLIHDTSGEDVRGWEVAECTCPRTPRTGPRTDEQPKPDAG